MKKNYLQGSEKSIMKRAEMPDIHSAATMSSSTYRVGFSAIFYYNYLFHCASLYFCVAHADITEVLIIL